MYPKMEGGEKDERKSMEEHVDMSVYSLWMLGDSSRWRYADTRDSDWRSSRDSDER